MRSIAGFHDEKRFKLRKGLNVVEAPNAGGKTSFIRGLRTMILPAELLKNNRHFLNMTAKSGSVHLRLDDGDYSRDLRDVSGSLSVTGKPITDEGSKADTLCVATRENLLLNLVESGGTLRPVLDEFSDSRYYRLGVSVLKARIRELNSEISKQNEEYQALKGFQKELAKLQKKERDLALEKEKLPEIPEADSKVMEANQKRLKERAGELSEARVELDNKIKDIKEREKGISGKKEVIEGYKKRIEDFKRRHPDADGEIAELEKSIRSLAEDRNNLYAEIRRISGQLDATRKAQTEASRSEANLCPACGGELTPEQLKKWEKNLQADYEEATKEMESINAQIEEKTRELDAVQEEVAKVKVGRSGDVKMLSDSERRLKDLLREVRTLSEKKDKLEQRISVLARDVEEIEKSIDPSIIDAIRLHNHIDTELRIVENDITRMKDAIEARGEAGKRVQELISRKNLLTSVTSYMQKESERLLMEVVNDFNDRIGEIYDLLEFKDFDRIYVDDYTFEINVIRKRKNQTVRQPLKSLAGSERATIALILMLAGKEKYLPDFPMFVIDAVSEDYDPIRLQRIVDYLEERVPYVIITTLSPHKGADDIVIRHELS